MHSAFKELKTKFQKHKRSTSILKWRFVFNYQDIHCVKRVVIQYCITRVFMCYAHVIHVLSACV